jgi:outer membrane murein-binding lipoprotein Lpp
MKKVLVVMFVLVMAVSLLPGCSCGGVSSEAVESLQQNLTALQDGVNTLQASITDLEQRVSALEK